MTTLSLSCFGPPRVELDGQPVHIANQKALALLVYLAMAGSTQRRDTLAALLWPDHGQRRARTYLRQALYALTQALGDHPFETSREAIGLCADMALHVDVLQFQAACEAVETAEEDELTRADVTQLEAIVTHYRDGFLAGFNLPDCPRFDRWCHVQSESIRRQLAEILQMLAAWHATHHAYDEAITHARRWLALDPLHEESHRTLMRLYARSGQRAAAVRQYEQCVERLNDELGLAPDEQTRALYDDIRAGRLSQSTQGEVRTHEATVPRQYLPCPPTPLIGREAELAELSARLTNPQVRLITIVGAGGMGKSRLALAAAEHALEHFPHGVYLVPLVGVDSPAALASAVAGTLGLDDAGGGSDRQRLAHFLRDKRLLLLLDNFEHLLDGADWLAELLQSAPRLTLLVTSRERLALHEEWLFPLRGLDYPPLDGTGNGAGNESGKMPAEGAAYPAVTLFAQCARKVRPDFSLADEWTGVTAICRNVEGMPLGIELAATWVRVMSCTEIAAELAKDLDVLSTSLRNLPEQHRSLRAVFERSWRLVDEHAQRVVRQLSVFRGGFDKEAAMYVAAANAEQLARLVDSSLLHWRPATGEQGERFEMHELLRQFAADKLAAVPGKCAQVRQRHCDYYGDWLGQMNWFLERTKPETEPQHHRETFRQVATDIDNVRVAWQWAVQERDADAIRLMMNMLVEYYDEAGAWDAGQQAFDAAICAFRHADSLPEAERASLVGALLLRRTWFMEGHVEKAKHHQLLAQSLELLRRGGQGESVDAALALVRLGAKSGGLGRNAEGAAYLAQALSIFRALDHAAGIGHALQERGTLAISWGRLAESARFLTQAARHLEERNQTMYWWTQHLLGVTCLMQGRYPQARTRLEGARAYFAQIHPDHGTVAYATRNLGDLATAMGDFARAESYFAEAKKRFTEMEQGWLIAIPMSQGPGDLARLRGNLDEAERVLEENVATARQLDFDQRITINLHNLSRLCCDQDRYQEAAELLDEALHIARRIDYRFATALVLCQRGHTAAALSEPTAAAYYDEALRIAQEEKIERVAVETLRGVAEQRAAAGEIEQAVALLALVAHHAASAWETKQKARQRLSELKACLSPDRFAAAAERGKAVDLYGIAERFTQAHRTRVNGAG